MALPFLSGNDISRHGDEIIISHLEHHANIVPWQMMCERKGASLKVIPIDDAGDIIFEEYLQIAFTQDKACLRYTGIQCTWNCSSCK